MERLNSQIDLDAFFTRVARAKQGAQQSALLLDYDGTLAPFVEDRYEAVPYPGVRRRLEALRDNPSVHLAIISGRWSRDLVPLLGIDPAPEIWGCHGGELRLPDGTVRNAELADHTIKGLVTIEDWVKLQGWEERIERKPASVAVHWRGLPTDEADTMSRRINRRWQHAVDDFALKLHRFDGGIEFRAAGIHKGGAIRSIIRDLPEDTPIAYLGDDRTDEDAFDALGDRGLKVLVRSEFRDTAANVWLKPPDELLAFLDRWLD
ncbi:trehalose-phosphatase [candidate division GN15 bacterium]|nr:trehalose-phosphatase [candidate division GN15 bacterium]